MGFLFEETPRVEYPKCQFDNPASVICRGKRGANRERIFLNGNSENPLEFRLYGKYARIGEPTLVERQAHLNQG
jgi:hypothetical protein